MGRMGRKKGLEGSRERKKKESINCCYSSTELLTGQRLESLVKVDVDTKSISGRFLIGNTQAYVRVKYFSHRTIQLLPVVLCSVIQPGLSPPLPSLCFLPHYPSRLADYGSTLYSDVVFGCIHEAILKRHILIGLKIKL